MIGLNQVHDLCRILTSLNYEGQQTLVVPESFSSPNFALVCRILKWFVRILDDQFANKSDLSLIPDDIRNISTISDSNQISFLVAATKLVQSHLGVKLDLVSLYKADQNSCVELYKIARPIYEAAKVSVGERVRCDDSTIIGMHRDSDNSIAELNRIINEGKSLKDFRNSIDHLTLDLDTLMNNEEKFAGERQKLIDNRVEVSKIGQVLQSAHSGILEKTEELFKSNEDLEGDLARLDERLESKEIELDEAKSRLNNLLIQAPVYVSQYESLHKKFEEAYESYVSKFRNLMYLKWCVSKFARVQEEYDQLDAKFADGGSWRAVDVTGRLSEIVGPAKLLESLFDTGTSNPISASLGSALTTGAGDAIGATGAAGLRREGDDPDGLRYVGRPAEAGDDGLELEGLLREFAADSEAISELRAASDDEDNADEEGIDDEDGETEEEDEDEEEEIGLDGPL